MNISFTNMLSKVDGYNGHRTDGFSLISFKYVTNKWSETVHPKLTLSFSQSSKH